MTVLPLDALPKGAHDILDLLNEMHSDGADWITRADMKDWLGIQRLNPAQLCHLDYLVRLGYLDFQRPVGELEYHYRVTDIENASTG